MDHRSQDTAIELLTAGRFSTLSLLSPKALRIYAERGLLVPFDTDPVTGYRFYHPDQVRLGWLISLLRGAEMPLEQVAAVVQADADSALAAIDTYESALTQRAAAGRFLLTRAREHYGETLMSEVITTVLPDQPVLSVLRRLYVDVIEEVIHESLAELRAVAHSAGLSEEGRPFGIFHSPVTPDSDGPLEIVLPVNDLAATTGDIRSVRLQGGSFAQRRLVGPETDFPAILGFYDEVRSWIDHEGHTAVGPPREIWHNSPQAAEPLELTIAWPYA
ncbi:MAG TPA: GyrI-like domain-containing protein [Propionibacteriaceae bacterium]|nr:GyrI-like domain-containing protein [Propionibacteriaceae bacterium]